ncbi:MULTISPECIES: S-layer homology domain-containing protein [Bacillus cereus group]|uniref:Calcium-binding protein n=5 Tax=Bacteria TaxID=2 RepID=A0A0J1HXI5_BACAN|nr:MULTISPECIES: S-layer homology domain-containing protein [Bacillus cereus group]ONG72200.1 calcium-binding protein [Bacillus cereus]HDR7766798.1 S-layer homology domain-containing protein [Bacillus paranthracis]EOQ19751.1 hypothetical protein IKC_04225 [Bacillus cereus VD184]KLV18402.1 calcium-binding protein [Bacillus anthracis]OUB76915.1 calcium-binding protein [Bacillus thuringiensis serovar jegathesan]
MKKIFLKISVVFSISFSTLFSLNNNIFASSSYTDVPEKHWATTAINSLYNSNIMIGYGYNTFGFGDVVTREQVARLMYTSLDLQTDDISNNPYRDINPSSTMFFNEVLSVTKKGIFVGDLDKNFRPKDPLTREELAQIFMKAFKLQKTNNHSFNDVDSKSWANDAISALQSNRITKGTSTYTYSPKGIVTREQFAVFLYNALLNTKNDTENDQNVPDGENKLPYDELDKNSEGKSEVIDGGTIYKG